MCKHWEVQCDKTVDRCAVLVLYIPTHTYVGRAVSGRNCSSVASIILVLSFLVCLTVLATPKMHWAHGVISSSMTGEVMQVLLQHCL
jgi:hypothetical protein